MLKIAVSSGEPAGIGPDICLSLAGYASDGCLPIVLGDRFLLAERARALNMPLDVRVDSETACQTDNTLWVRHIDLAAPSRPGVLDARNSPYVLALLDEAHAGIEANQYAALVTAPVHKGVINDAGVVFSGHTEYLAQKSQTPQVVMMLAGGGLRVALATTHLPLKQVAPALTQELLVSVGRILNHDLQQKFGLPRPRIKAAGLNPHAGENGHLGREEIDVIVPAINALRAQGVDIRGPHPADTLFQPFMLEDCDAVLAMYHDQGLPTLKYASFGEGVNITLGLSFIRTSVDHGTALDLAGSGRARSGSLKAAFDLAAQMAQQSQSLPKFTSP